MRLGTHCARPVQDSPEPEAKTPRVTESVKIGDTVRRPATESSASVRQLLEHLEHTGFDGAPRFLGTEPDGSMVLSWIEGRVPADTECWRLGRSELASVGELLRSYHDCVAGFAPEAGFEEGPQAVAAGQVVCHGDIAPRNCVFLEEPPGCLPAGFRLTTLRDHGKCMQLALARRHVRSAPPMASAAAWATTHPCATPCRMALRMRLRSELRRHVGRRDTDRLG